jgi:hypothetical protein
MRNTRVWTSRNIGGQRIGISTGLGRSAARNSAAQQPIDWHDRNVWYVITGSVLIMALLIGGLLALVAMAPPKPKYDPADYQRRPVVSAGEYDSVHTPGWHYRGYN